jgi:hypothetical protein
VKRSWREIVNRITGFELPFSGGGISWEPRPLDVEIARELLTFLEDRRALYQPYECETASYVVRSILSIRERLTEDLEKLDRSSPLAESMLAMRAACRKFLNEVEGIDIDLTRYRRSPVWDEDERDFFMALGGLRSIIGVHAAQIAVKYKIDVEDTLVRVFPPPSEG